MAKRTVKPNTQKRIGELVGVSRTAVFHVLKNPRTNKVSEDVKKQILETAKKLEYFGDARGRRGRIAFAIEGRHPVLEPICQKMISMLQKRGRELGIEIVMKTFHRSMSGTDILFNLNCDGILSFHGLGAAAIRGIKEKLPLVLVQCNFIELDCDMVSADESAGVEMLVEHLINLGHRRIAYFAPHTENLAPLPGQARMQLANLNVPNRISGYLAELIKAGLPVDDNLIMTDNKAEEIGVCKENYVGDSIDYLMALPAPPTAIVAYNDVVAMGLIRELAKKGVRVPGDISVGGFEDFYAETSDRPRLTTVDTVLLTQAKLGLEELLTRIYSPNASPNVEIFVKPRLVIRETTGPARNAD